MAAGGSALAGAAAHGTENLRHITSDVGLDGNELMTMKLAPHAMRIAKFKMPGLLRRASHVVLLPTCLLKHLKDSNASKGSLNAGNEQLTCWSDTGFWWL